LAEHEELQHKKSNSSIANVYKLRLCIKSSVNFLRDLLKPPLNGAVISKSISLNINWSSKNAAPKLSKPEHILKTKRENVGHPKIVIEAL